MDLVRKEKHGLGRGRSLEMRLTIPPELVNTVASSLNADKPVTSTSEKDHTHPISEYVNQVIVG
jgi:hypothetical protein